MYRLIDYGPQVRDRQRVDAYRRALAAVITPATTLLDLGTGLGTFSVLACKLGARRVYAVEPLDIIAVAEEIALTNGVADRITFIQGRSTEITLPEQVDVIVSELSGALPLFEDHLPAIIDARERFLKPGGVLIPRRARLLCAPVSNSDLRAQITEPWRSVPEIDFGPAEAMGLQAPHAMAVRPEDLAGEGRVWAELDYLTVQSPSVSGDVEWKIEKPVHAIALWFEHTMHGDVRFSSGPWTHSVHATIVLPLLQPLEGNTLSLSIASTLAIGRYVTTWHARTERDPGARQSTFLSEARSAASLADRRQVAGGEFPLQAAFRASERVLARRVASELLLLDLSTGVYHVLNETGAEVWNLLENGARIDAIAEAIARQFDVDADRAANDVAAIVAELCGANLIEPCEAPPR